MDKNAKVLIQKLAGIPQGLKNLRSGGSMAHMSPRHQTYAAGRSNANLFGQRAAKTPVGADRSADIEVGKGQKALTKKESADMREIIDDIIKGAKDNGFGRPVNIQMSGSTPDWTPLDTAKCAGMLIALDEQGYTLKEASEFLGLSEGHLQAVIKTVG